MSLPETKNGALPNGSVPLSVIVPMRLVLSVVAYSFSSNAGFKRLKRAEAMFFCETGPKNFPKLVLDHFEMQLSAA